jgi:hypothetical protein
MPQIVEERLINTETLEEIIELVLWSGRIANADPLSLIISSKVGAGKTKILKQYSNVLGAKYLTEVTAYGIKRYYLDKIKSGEIRHLLIGDFLAELSKQKKTKDDTIAFFNELMEEGVNAVASYAVYFDEPDAIKCGIITTIAQADFLRKSHRWYEMGFLSRAIPLTYSYSKLSEVKIYKHIAECTDMQSDLKKDLWLPKIPVRVIPNKNLNTQLIEVSMKMSEWEKAYGFRKQEQLQTLMMANALKRGSMEVEQEDYDKVLELTQYINMYFNEV